MNTKTVRETNFVFTIIKDSKLAPLSRKNAIHVFAKPKANSYAAINHVIIAFIMASPLELEKSFR